MAQIKIGDPHGLYRVFVGLVDENGYNYGTAGSGVAASTLVSPYMMKYAKNAEIAQNDRNVIDFTGGDVWTGSYVYGITSLGTFSLTSSTLEADLIALTSGGQVDQTLNTLQTVFAENILRSTPPQVWVMIVYRIQSKESGSTGANKYLTVVCPRTWTAPKGVSGAPAFQSAGEYGFTMVPTVGDRMPWGPSFAETTSGASGTIGLDQELNQTPTFYVISDYPLHAVGQKPTAGSSNEDVVLPFVPAGVQTDYTTPDSSTQRVQVYVDGVQVDAASVTLSTKTVVVAPPGGTWAGTEYIGVLYETAYNTDV